MKGNHRGSFVLSVVVMLFFVILFHILIRTFVFSVSSVTGESMQPTFPRGDGSEQVVVNHMAYRLGSPEHCDVVVFRPPGKEGKLTKQDRMKLNFFHRIVSIFNDDRYFIKRVIATENNKVVVDESSNVYVNGKRRIENFVTPPDPYRYAERVGTEVPPNHIFVMGDHRDNSEDSRHLGPIPIENVEGRVDLQLWPLSKFGFLDNSKCTGQ
ncbi:signal peptidase I [Pasteuria penetrans]|uniref:signal peptidase I n=1 Tax=Pasteuria penetrans TaxID=86005 RepID=UPI000F9A0CA5|nr:signal peptidase I [Pasteuria penetrans]